MNWSRFLSANIRWWTRCSRRNRYEISEAHVRAHFISCSTSVCMYNRTTSVHFCPACALCTYSNIKQHPRHIGIRLLSIMNCSASPISRWVMYVHVCSFSFFLSFFLFLVNVLVIYKRVRKRKDHGDRYCAKGVNGTWMVCFLSFCLCLSLSLVLLTYNGNDFSLSFILLWVKYSLRNCPTLDFVHSRSMYGREHIGMWHQGNVIVNTHRRVNFSVQVIKRIII